MRPRRRREHGTPSSEVRDGADPPGEREHLRRTGSERAASHTLAGRLLVARPEGGHLVVGHTAWATLQRHRQMRIGQDEAGGVLLGRLIRDAADVVIDRATEPAATDRRGRYFFWRARRTTQQLVDAAWRESGGTQRYLGEWHTHPEDDPTPSTVDLENWRRVLREARFEHAALWFIIVGRRVTRVWEGDRSGRIVQLSCSTRRMGSGVDPQEPHG